MRLTPNFTLAEFLHPGAKANVKVISNLELLAQRLQVVRDLLGKKITITSGYRSPEHNQKVGGASNSLHLQGKAADIVVEGMSAREVQTFLKNWSGGLGSYNTWTHVDIGPERRWSE